MWNKRKSCIQSHFIKGNQQASGKIYLFYSPSQQEEARRIFPRKDAFAWLKKRGVKKKPMAGRTRLKTRRFPRKKLKREIFNKLLQYLPLTLSYTLFCVSLEESVLTTDISKNSSHRLLLFHTLCSHQSRDPRCRLTFGTPAKDIRFASARE